MIAETVDSIDFLLNNNADSSILNEDSLAPIHLAVEENNIESLKVSSIIKKSYKNMGT